MCNSDGTLDLAGTWAMRLDLGLDMHSQAGGAATLCPEQQSGKASMILLLRTTQPAGGTSLASVQPIACSLTLPAATGMVGECDPTAPQLMSIDILTSPALQSKLASIPIPPVQGTVSTTAPGASLSIDRFFMAAGTRNAADALPTWNPELPGCGPNDALTGRDAVCEQDCVDDCSALLDDDADGWPATSFHICGYTADDKKAGLKCHADDPAEAGIVVQGRMNMAFVVDPALEGTAVSSCEVRGKADAHVLYHVVGGDIYLVGTALSVVGAFKSLPLFDVDTQSSVFRMLRVDGKHGAPYWKTDLSDPAAACALALQHQNDLL